MQCNDIDILYLDKMIQNNFKAKKDTDIDNLDSGLNMSPSLQKFLVKKKSDIRNEDSNFYLLDTMELIHDYKRSLKNPIKINFLDNHNISDNFSSTEKNAIIEKFIDKIKFYKDIDYSNVKSNNDNMNCNITEQSCQVCFSKNITESIEYVGIIICLDCGNQETTMNLANSIRLNHNDSKRINICSKYAYDKKSHFQNCINQYQGKHKTGIEPDIIKSIENELEKYNLFDKSKKTKKARCRNITKEHIFLFVKELKLTKCYGDINLIHHIITDYPLNDISHLTEKLLQDFEQFVQMHNKFFPDDSERKNFNYQHLLYQLLIRHKYPCNPNEFNFLKTIDRKYYHDETCRIIFENLGWNYSSLF